MRRHPMAQQLAPAKIGELPNRALWLFAFRPTKQRAMPPHKERTRQSITTRTDFFQTTRLAWLLLLQLQRRLQGAGTPRRAWLHHGPYTKNELRGRKWRGQGTLLTSRPAAPPQTRVVPPAPALAPLAASPRCRAKTC